MRTLSACLFLLPILCSAAEGDGEWTYLFKGATHGDFYFDFLQETDPEDVFIFTGEDGLLIKGEDKPVGYIQTLDEYSNYELAFEWRWPDEPGESGILVHSASFQAYSIWPESIEVQIAPGHVGDFWLLNQTLEVTEEQLPEKAADRNRRLKLEDAEKEPGEWNHMRIVVMDDTIKVYLNNELVNEGKSASVTSGFITIQVQESNIEFRGFRLLEREERVE